MLEVKETMDGDVKAAAKVVRPVRAKAVSRKGDSALNRGPGLKINRVISE
jgi:hypothetical protein